jgi:hypothetical protein
MKRRLLRGLKAGVLLIAVAVIAVSGFRRWLELDMARHMLLEFPLLLAAGAILARRTPHRAQAAITACDRLGISGCLLATLVLGFWMIPAALDAALAGAWVQTAKILSLLATGAALRLSLPAAPLAIQGFFVVSSAWMIATVGLLYQEAPQQLCLYYLSSAQAIAGEGLVFAALLVGGAWCVHAVRNAAITEKFAAAPAKHN